MPANTLTDMILGYAVILGILLIYILTLIIRTRKARTQRDKNRQD
jgi:hypothetical protein